jgi:hypothetical protein
MLQMNFLFLDQFEQKLVFYQGSIEKTNENDHLSLNHLLATFPLFWLRLQC